MTDGWQAAGRGVAVRRCDPARVRALRARDPASGPPVGVNRTAGTAPRILGLGPREWLIVGDNATDWPAPAPNGRTTHLADVTGAWTRFSIAGPETRTLLSKGCTLDFHPRAFRADSCAQSALAQLRVLIDRVSAEDAFHVYVDASYVHYLQLWFVDALVEFGQKA